MVKISFGMIVFNAETVLPKGMLEACIENVYDIAHEILICEGATKADLRNHYFDGDTSFFTKDGKSTDNTIEIIKSIPDPKNKIKLIKSNDFWNGKTVMCNEYLKLATGDYIWQLDSDEFYKKDAMEKVIKFLEKHKVHTGYFPVKHFWGSWNTYIDVHSPGKWIDKPFTRLFRHIPNQTKWKSHEPPLMNYTDVDTNLHLQFNGIDLFHYSYVQKSQIDFKSKFFKNPDYISCWENWQKDQNSELIFGEKTKPINPNEHPEIIKERFL